MNAFAQGARRASVEIAGRALLGACFALFQVSRLFAAEPALAGCTIERLPHAKHAETATIIMHVASDGSSCTLTPHVGKGGAQSISIIQPPKNGKLAIAVPSAVYTPTPGFAGSDTFLVAWFGTGFGPNSHSANLRTRVEVQIVAK